MQQFSRLVRILGNENLAKLKNSRVLVAGIGAVGGQVFETLVRSGIGHFILVDGDQIAASNLNRQILALHSTIGQRKTTVAKNRGMDINPEASFLEIDVYIDPSTIGQIIAAKPDLVIDAIDTLPSKALLIKTCLENKIPVLSSMGAARKFDPAQVKLTTLDQTSICPLAKLLKSRLKREHVDLKKIICAFSAEIPKPDLTQDLDESAKNEKGIHGKAPLGSLPSVTAAFGLILSQAAVDILTGRKPAIFKYKKPKK